MVQSVTCLFRSRNKSFPGVRGRRVEKMEEREIELIDYINVILKRKRFIIIGTIICLLSSAIYSYGRRSEPEYEAKASLLVTPPPYKAELTPPGLSVFAYDQLARAQDLEQAIIDSLGLKDEYGKPLSIGGLDGMFGVEVVEVTAPTSPIINFSVTSKSSNLSVQIVNKWADLFVKKNSGLTSQAISGSYEFILGQYDVAKKFLEDKEDALREFKGNNPLVILSNERAPESNKLKEFQTAYTNQRFDLKAKQENLKQQENLLDAMEMDGRWVGTLVEEGEPVSYEGLTDGQEETRRLVVDVKRYLLHTDNQLISFKNEHRIDLLKAEVEQKTETLAAHQKELVKIELGREMTRLALEQIDQQLKNESPALVLSKAITDDALWQKSRDGALSPENLRKLEKYKLHSEELNPVYVDLLKKKAAQELAARSLSPKKVILNDEIERLKKELPILQKDLREKKRQQAVLENRSGIARKTLDALWKRYSDVKASVEQTRLGILSAKESFSYTHSTLEASKVGITDLDEQIGLLQLEQTRMERDVGMYKSTFERFSKLAEDVRVAKAGEVSDLKVVSRAVEATVVVPEKRSTVVLAGGIGLIVTVFIAFLMEYVEKARLKNEDGTENK